MTARVGVSVQCVVCGNTKKPVGRSAPMQWYGCDDDCKGYRMYPFAGSLWPGESEADFGYPVGDDGPAPISTGGERRKRQEQPERYLAIEGEDRRVGQRRTASYRGYLEYLFCNPFRIQPQQFRDLIAALRKEKP